MQILLQKGSLGRGGEDGVALGWTMAVVVVAGDNGCSARWQGENGCSGR